MMLANRLHRFLVLLLEDLYRNTPAGAGRFGLL